RRGKERPRGGAAPRRLRGRREGPFVPRPEADRGNPERGMTMSCERMRELSRRDRLAPEDEVFLARHLASCEACASEEAEEAALSDALVAAAAAFARVRRLRRRAASALVAASVLLSIAVVLRSAFQPPRTVYVIRGDSSGV